MRYLDKANSDSRIVPLCYPQPGVLGLQAAQTDQPRGWPRLAGCLAPGAAADHPEQWLREVEHAAKDHPNAKPLLLLVDDMPDNLQALEAGLAADFRLAMARHGERALHLAQEKLPDLILLDVMMPGIDGFDVCERLKANHETMSIPVIFLTALGDEESEARGLDLGAADYIHKPFNMRLVRRRVRTHLRAARARDLLRDRAFALEQAAHQREEIDRVMRHDLKGPLSPILGVADMMMEDDNLTDEQRDNLQLVRSAGEQMLGMIQRSLDLFKMETGRYRYHPRSQDVVFIIQRTLERHRLLAADYGAELQLKTAAEAILFPVEDMLLYNLLDNLVRNAIEAAAPGDMVTVAVRERRQDPFHARELSIRVSNPALVPEIIKAKFFDKYVTSGKSQGTGLGTYSARLIAETMGGKLEMQSEAGLGTLLTLSLPEILVLPEDCADQ